MEDVSSNTIRFRCKKLDTKKKETQREIILNQFCSARDDYNSLQEILIRQALYFLKQRGISKQQIQKYNIGCCLEGEYESRIIIPSYNADGQLNYFIARSFDKDNNRKYKNPSVQNKNIIGLEYFINWDAPIVLVEGIFDALTIQRNVIPLFGKTLSEALMKRLVTSDVEKVYVALDKDAQREALQHCQTLINYGKEVYLVEMDGKDANEIGFKNFLDIIENTYPLTFEKIMGIKLKLS